ncbi:MULTISPECIES: aldose epimerase family protein [Anaerotruncus]|uniref:aldose epimerase family protein n=1 Tax=Anaerotruncus TaxID=244127 RepID=UPI0013146F15|nr:MULTISPECIES: aldose epimerase family protein [Anaerotruncus]
MSVTVKTFGHTADGRAVRQFIISAAEKRMVSLIELGGCIQGLWVADKGGNLRDVVLGYDTVAEYEENPTFFGAVLGRLISRMPDCTLHFEGRDYPLDHIDGMHMHGGVKGFSRVKWDGAVIDDNQVQFTYISPDGEEGYPGEVIAKVLYTLDEDGLTIDYDMTADRRTVINPSNHSYFNLNGHDSGNIRSHTLRCPVTGSFNQLTEERAPLFEGTDLNEERVLGDIFDLHAPSMEEMGGGIDHKFILSDLSARIKDAGTLYSPASGIEMRCLTTMPCIMIYTGNMIDNLRGKCGFHYQKQAGICFETMLFSSLHDLYGSVAIIEPGKHHRSRTQFLFSTR